MLIFWYFGVWAHIPHIKSGSGKDCKRKESLRVMFEKENSNLRIIEILSVFCVLRVLSTHSVIWDCPLQKPHIFKIFYISKRTLLRTTEDQFQYNQFHIIWPITRFLFTSSCSSSNHLIVFTARSSHSTLWRSTTETCPVIFCWSVQPYPVTLRQGRHVYSSQ